MNRIDRIRDKTVAARRDTRGDEGEGGPLCVRLALAPGESPRVVPPVLVVGA